MQLHLVDSDHRVAVALQIAFARFPEVSVAHGDLLAVAKNCAVSPANSYGFMDGGIDLIYVKYFGPQIQQQVHDAIARRPEGHLPVGASLVIRTTSARIPYLILAPTMLLPESIDASHCYRALRAVLRIADDYAEISSEVYCPGLGTGVGKVQPADAASAMAEAYDDWRKCAHDTTQRLFT